MTRYIDKDKMSVKDRESLRLFATAISAVTRSSGNDLSELVSNYLIKGKIINPVTKTEMKVPGFPKKDLNPQTSYNNLKDFFGELFETFSFDPKTINTFKKLDDNYRVKFALRILNTQYTPDMEIRGMEGQMNSNDKSTYENYLSFARAHAVHESRPKPKWYEFGKRYSQWKESKQLEKFEKLLAAKGVKPADLERAKHFDPTRQEIFETKLNFYDQLKAIKEELRSTQLQVSEYDPKAKASSKTGQEFLKHATKAYELINDIKNKVPDAKNPYEKEAYDDIQYIKNNIDDMVRDRIEFDTTTLEDIKEEVRARDLASKDFTTTYKEAEKVHVKFEKEAFSESEVEFNLDKPLDDSLDLENDLENQL